jgi:hypothetical protein
MGHKIIVGMMLILLLIGTRGVSGQEEDEPTVYVHSSGYYQVLVPAGSDWAVTENNSSDWLITNLISFEQQSVIKYAVTVSDEFEYTPQMLSDDYLTADYFGVAWSGYEGWDETDRVVSARDVQTDFELVWHDAPMLARDFSWEDAGRIYSVQIVVPATESLEPYEALLDDGFVTYPDLQRLDAEWPIYTDPEQRFIFKYPPTMYYAATDESVMFISTLENSQSTITVWTVPETASLVPDDWTPDGVKLLASIPLERGTASGYELSYTYASGDLSGMTLLLLDDDQTLYAVTMDFAAEYATEDPDLAQEALNARLASHWGLVFPESPNE